MHAVNCLTNGDWVIVYMSAAFIRYTLHNDNFAWQAFVAKESSFEGAELPAAASREGVSFDGKRFLTELGAALGMQPGDADPFLQDLASDSEDEGSSFFGGASEDTDVSSIDDDDASAEPDAPNVYQAQRAERSHNGRVLPESGQPSSSAEAAAQRGMDSSSRASGRELASARKAATGAAEAAPRKAAPSASHGFKRGFLSGSGAAHGRPGKAAASSGAAGAAAASKAGAGVASAAGREGTSAADEDRWETMTATDSDDEEADFMSEYEERMERELGRSKVGASFARRPTPAYPAGVPADAKGKGKAADVEDMGDAPGYVGAHAAQTRAGGDVEEEEEELRPVDIDLNLVQNLLASYSGQQGLPGPVSNLMGLMGLHLPDDEDTRGKSEFDAFMS